MYLFPRPIIDRTQNLLMVVGFLNLYQEDTSLKGNSALFMQFIYHWDHERQALCICPSQWFQPTEEDIYSIIELSRRGEYFP